MRSIVLVCFLIAVSSEATAACRCACVKGIMRPICQQVDLVEPICQGFCTDDLRPEAVSKPLSGGQQQFNPVQSVEIGRPIISIDPRTGSVENSTNYDTDTRGYSLGTAGVQTGSSSLSSSAPAINAGGSGR